MPAPTESKAKVMEAVTVSATRRHEPSRDVPIQVNVLSAEHLEQTGATSLSDYVGNLPGVDFKTGNGPGLGTVSIRGITTGGDAVATVGIYIDDVAFGSNSSFASGASSALDMSLLDLDHIEVLRGPQGTLYGAGAMGGLLKYVTNEPDSYEFSGKASVGVESVNRGGIGHVESGVINVPLKQGVAALRVAAFQDNDTGYIDAVGPAAGKNINGGKSSGGRVSLLIEPASTLKIRLTAVAQNIRRDSNGTVDYDVATGRPIEGDLVTQLSVREPYAVNTRLVSGDIEYDMGWARLNSISSHQEVNRRDRVDASFYDGPLSDAVGVPITRSKLDSWASVRKNTQEFRLTSAPGAFEWLAGAYYDEETAKRPQVLSGNFEADQSPIDVVSAQMPSTYKELAIYGDATMTIATDWSLTLG
ncbi:MAG: TonB-dependent receptor, partial [Rhodanobacter sp.]